MHKMLRSNVRLPVGKTTASGEDDGHVVKRCTPHALARTRACAWGNLEKGLDISYTHPDNATKHGIVEANARRLLRL